MRTKFRRHRLHPVAGEVPENASNLTLALIFGALVLVVLVAIFVPAVSGALEAVGLLAQLLLFVGIMVAAMIGRARLRHRIGEAEEAVRAAAGKDAFWSPETIKARVESLFEPYWRAVQQRSTASIAAELTPSGRQRLDEAFAIWIERGFKPVLFDLALQGVDLMTIEDHDDPQKDRFVAVVACRTSYHVTDTLSGEVVEGFPDSYAEQQAWHFVRGAHGWLLDRVERLAGNAGA